MRPTLLLSASLALFASGCATTSSDVMLIQAGADMRCMQQEVVASDGIKYATRWCSSRQIFQPNRHVVRVNGQTLLDGNDREDVRAEQTLGAAKVVAACTPRIEILDLRTEGTVLLSTLPESLVSACKITADERGFHRAFLRDQECLKVYSATVGPLVGKTLPFKRTQECQVQAAGSTVFKGTFVYR